MNDARTNSAVQATVPLPAWGDITTDRLGFDGTGRMITKRYLTGGINVTTHAYSSSTALVGYTTAFDRASNKLYERHLEAETRSHLYQPFNNLDGSFCVGYDSANRLLQYQRGTLSTATIPYRVNAGAFISTPITLPGTERSRTYGLDGLGNWKTSNSLAYDGTTATKEVRVHNYVNEITSVKDNTSDPVPFTYDACGNLLNDGVRLYQYDVFNRLSQISHAPSGTDAVWYLYDTFGRRVQKAVIDTSVVTNYLYDGQQIIAEYDDSAMK